MRVSFRPHETTAILLPYFRRALDGAKKINIGPRFPEGEQYSPWWTAALLQQNADDRHDLRAAIRLPMEGVAGGFRTLADGLFPVAAVV